MALNLSTPEAQDLRPRITVFGVGGAGGNAVNNMISKNLEGAEFVVANTDAQALAQSKAERRVQLGGGVTRGLGAGAKPQVGSQAAEESLEELVDALAGSHMCFITAGMGGGTGTGAAPVIARAAREMGILTVGVVTKPFHFEGTTRMRLAEGGIDQLQSVVDTLIIIPNQNLFRIANERTTFADAFMMADDVLYQGVKGVTDLMVRPGLINLDFADVRAVMDEMGKAMMGTGEAEGETRAVDAAEKAIANPLLDEVSLKGARGVLINITGGYDLTLFELDEAANRIRSEVDPNANIIVGSTLDPEMSNVMRVSVVATGIDALGAQQVEPEPEEQRPAPRYSQPVSRVGMAPAQPAQSAPQPARPTQPARPAQPAPRPAAAVERRAPASPARPALRAVEPHGGNVFDEAHDERGFDAEADFELDDGSMAPAPTATQPEPSRDHPFLVAERRAAEPEAARPVAAAAAQVARPAPRGEEPRGRGFGFNSLIHRMTGSAAPKEREEPFPFTSEAMGIEQKPRPRAQSDDDTQIDVPAFLRRQAN